MAEIVPGVPYVEPIYKISARTMSKVPPKVLKYITYLERKLAGAYASHAWIPVTCDRCQALHHGAHVCALCGWDKSGDD